MKFPINHSFKVRKDWYPMLVAKARVGSGEDKERLRQVLIGLFKLTQDCST